MEAIGRGILWPTPLAKRRQHAGLHGKTDAFRAQKHWCTSQSSIHSKTNGGFDNRRVNVIFAAFCNHNFDLY
ncbi:hypothetical protein OU994_17395 [Pseudoduganella sp. SL102]|uniref:hypothetical protein n=1 Tax=Pseudoduganella sp. SL102 TaxID=2995154 RepID=UPI00248ABCD0|nr:hypothetical protein [Pseudoduganella sp. SL102]WBS00098.1 hypothetical protein OU994_17395 [Pseudoduganella sp. SL102]